MTYFIFIWYGLNVLLVMLITTQVAITRSKLTTETPEKGVKYVQS